MRGTDRTEPTDRGAWVLGARTVARAQAESGLSRDELWELMNAGVVRWFAHGGRGTRLLSWGDVVAFLEKCNDEYWAAAPPRRVGGRV